MIFLEILVLAIMQGITEFLPISSSGHFVVLASLLERGGMPLDEKLAVNVILHVGSLAAIVVFYWRRIWRLLSADRRVIGLLAVASVPAAAVGFLLREHAKNALEDPLTAGLMFLVTAAMLLWTSRHQSGDTLYRDLSYPRAMAVGVMQAFAILPGISRSGSTIVAGMAVGLRRDEAATFSFLMAIPVIAGAGLLEVWKHKYLVGKWLLELWEHKNLVEQTTSATPVIALVLGAATSFAVGLLALAWLVRWIQQGQLHRFAWWLLVVGPLVIAWQLLERWR